MTLTLTANKKSLTIGETLTLTAKYTPSGEGETLISVAYYKDDTIIEGENTNTYTIDSVKKGDAGKYKAIATYMANDETKTEESEIIDVTVKNKTFVKLDVLVTGETTLKYGDALTLTAAVDVDPTDATLSYQWLKDGSDISGETGKTLNKTVVLSDAGNYSVKVIGSKTDYTNKTTTSVGVDVTVTNKDFTTLEVGIDGYTTIVEGETLTLTAAIVADPSDATLTYQWSKDDVDIVNGTNKILTKVVTMEDAGKYSVKVTGSKVGYNDKVSTSDVTVTVNEVVEPVDPSELNHIFEFTERKSCGFTIGWWVKDEIDALTKEGKKWRDEIENMKYKKEAKTLAYALDNYDHIEVMETRNGYILKEKYFTE